jgi:hypothetical protein
LITQSTLEHQLFRAVGLWLMCRQDAMLGHLSQSDRFGVTIGELDWYTEIHLIMEEMQYHARQTPE